MQSARNANRYLLGPSEPAALDHDGFVVRERATDTPEQGAARL